MWGVTGPDIIDRKRGSWNDKMAILPDDLKTAIDKYNDEAMTVLQKFAKHVESKSPPKLIYHYTDDAGLKGIIENGTLWFTDVFNLNDPSEIRHGFSEAVSVLESKASGSHEEISRFVKAFKLFDVEIEEAANLFVCCFSGNGDELGQWRAYADDGRGYALGFHTDILEKAFTEKGGAPDPQHLTFWVNHNDGDLRRLQGEIADKMVPIIPLAFTTGLNSFMFGNCGNVYRSELSVAHAANAAWGVFFFKHEAYKNENEYRFLQVYGRDHKGLDVKYRRRAYSLVRYRAFDWKSTAPGALSLIRVGPAADKQKTRRFAKHCLDAFHSTKNIEIDYSLIPYR